MAAQVRCGTKITAMGDQWVGKTVEWLRMKLEADLQIPLGAPSVVSRDGGMSSHSIQEGYILQHGDLLEFVRPAGTKGS